MRLTRVLPLVAAGAAAAWFLRGREGVGQKTMHHGTESVEPPVAFPVPDTAEPEQETPEPEQETPEPEPDTPGPETEPLDPADQPTTEAPALDLGEPEAEAADVTSVVDDLIGPGREGEIMDADVVEDESEER